MSLSQNAFFFVLGSLLLTAAPAGAEVTHKNPVTPNFTVPPLSLRPGQKTIDHAYGTEVLRVTDSGNCGPAYAYWPSFNSNGQRLLMRCGNDFMLADFNPTTFTSSNVRPANIRNADEGAIWCRKDPNRIWTHSGSSITKFDVATGTTSTVRNLAGVGGLPSDLFIWQMSVDNNDCRMAFTINEGFRGCAVYDRCADSVVLLLSTPGLDECQIDKSGEWVKLTTGESGRGQIETQIYNVATKAVTNIIDEEYSPGHGDVGVRGIIAVENWHNTIFWRSFGATQSTKILADMGNDWTQDLHIGLNTDTNDTAVASRYGNEHGYLRSEIFLISISGSQPLRRILDHGAVVREYGDQPWANSSRDGRYVAFGSNFGGQERFMWVARAGGGSADPGPGEGDAVAPVISNARGTLTSSEAIIRWNTDEPATTLAVITAPIRRQVSGTTLKVAHGVRFTRLTASTTYRLTLTSRDAAGNTATKNFRFTTKTAPVSTSRVKTRSLRAARPR